MSSSTQDLIPQLQLGTTFGALFIGVIVAAVLFGLSNIQTFFYFQSHKDTGISFHKLAVIWLWILDALHLSLIVHCIYYYLVVNFANISALTEIVWSFKLQIVVLLIIYVVHILYVYRIWIVAKGRSRAIPIAVGIIEIIGSGVGIALLLTLYWCHVFADLLRTEWATYMALGTTAFIDIVIALSLCYLLATARTGFSSTDSLITKLMAYIINTGGLTSICSMIAMITCAVMPKNFIFLGVEFLLAKLYVNSFLALLNAQYYLPPTTDTNNSYQFQNRHGVYRPELHVKASQDEEFKSSRKDVFKHPDDEMVHPTRSVMTQRPIEVTVQMDSFSSV
ncbi:hypothetical protein EDB19DRAFT_1915414 [Suillus lakei]|nr:hypothetical protein EDB19DRAFT_1915414 [Suillus lakei]